MEHNHRKENFITCKNVTATNFVYVSCSLNVSISLSYEHIIRLLNMRMLFIYNSNTMLAPIYCHFSKPTQYDTVLVLSVCVCVRVCFQRFGGLVSFGEFPSLFSFMWVVKLEKCIIIQTAYFFTLINIHFSIQFVCASKAQLPLANLKKNYSI